MLIDPVGQIIRLLQPSASFSKFVTATSPWAVRPPGEGPFYAALLEGDVELSMKGHSPVRLSGGDFILMPASTDFTVTGVASPSDLVLDPIEISPGVFHVGGPGEPDTRMLVGYCSFGTHDAGLLVSLLPSQVIVRGERRLTTLVELLNDETRAARPARDAVLAHLLEVLLIEAFRASKGPAAAPGLLRGLADERLAAALRCMHGEPTRSWTVGGRYGFGDALLSDKLTHYVSLEFSRFRAGEPNRRRAVSRSVDDVIRAIVEVGGEAQ